VNDVAERTVALMSTYNKCLARKEDELQDVLQVLIPIRTFFYISMALWSIASVCDK
jgi:hypothetical protein